MFIREVKNRSGSISIQVISKSQGGYKVIKTIGCGTTRQEIDRLNTLARQELERLEAQPSFFPSENDELVEQAFSSLYNSSIRTVGPELIFGRI
jgi:hypothetical protein